MQRELTVKDCNLGPCSDLTVVAPIIKGFVPALDAVTYKTRVKRVLRTLHSGRATSHEFDLARLLSDSVERVGRIQSVRIAVIEPQDLVLLCVTFDGAWESYVRVIWQKVARLLDLIFCNTENYVNGWHNSFDAWGAWLRGRQAETSFLYATPGFAVGDAQYLRMSERLQRHRVVPETALDRICAPVAEEIAWQGFNNATNPTHLGLGQPLDGLVEARPALFRQGLRSLAGLFRLADVYPPGSADGLILHRATTELLPDFMRLLPGPMFLQAAWDRAYPRFGEALDWISEPEVPALPLSRQPPPLPALPPMPPLDQLQGGIVKAYRPGGHGVLLLVAFKSPAALAALLQGWQPTSAADQTRAQDGDIVANIALALEALRVAGLTGEQVAALPVEFAQGMDKRSGLLGDVRANHPRRWRLPLRNWHLGPDSSDAREDAPGERVAMSAVHAVLQLRLIDPGLTTSQAIARPRLFAELKRLMQLHEDLEPLSVQWMESFASADHQGMVEHFGFREGLSQPRFEAAEAGRFFKNQVHLGEALVGHDNAAESAAPIQPGLTAELQTLHELLQDGSFLVVRKLRQDLAQMDKVLAQATTDTGLSRETLLGKMMGLWPEGHADAGKPLAPLSSGRTNPNDFLYRGDPEGRLCPLQAHIRRANPRAVVPQALKAQMENGGRPPRLLRRGMSYGPRHDPKLSDAAQRQRSLQRERGLMFLAYNASLGEQFEVVQQWLAGGNSTGGYSGQSDPFMGLPEPGLVRQYRFEDEPGARTVRMALDGDTDMLADPQPLVRLEWGGYYFAPSLPALKQLAAMAEKAEQTGRPRYAWSPARGEIWIKRLQAAEQSLGTPAARDGWKSLLEDPGAAAEMWTADIWAAVRQLHGGVLRTPYAVLVGSSDEVKKTLLDAPNNLTSTEYLPRMRRSFGEIYLGLDAGQPDQRYETESAVCNQAIMARDKAATRLRAHNVVDRWLQAKVAECQHHAQIDEAVRRQNGATPRERVRWELTLEVRELIEELLAVFCEDWFGLKADTPHFQRSGQRTTWQVGDPPCYPGHFMAPSRYIFQAHPGATVKEVGAAHGQAMLKAMKAFLAAKRYKVPKAPVSHAVLTQGPGVKDRDLAARSIIGALMGMVPTVDANLRRVCHLWMNEGTLWLLRAQSGGASLDDVSRAFVRAMLSRAAPDTLWRTVQKPHRIGTEGPHAVAVAPGDLVVVGLSSATQHHLELGQADPSPAFGGHRRLPPDPANAHPVHACPGYDPAMAMMMGFFDALVQTALPLRAGPSPLTLMLDGHEPYVPPDAGRPQVVASTQAAPLRPTDLRGGAMYPASAASNKIDSNSKSNITKLTPLTALAAFGDSWLNWLPVYPELIGALPKVGYEVMLLESDAGRTLADMAQRVADFANLLADDTVAKPAFKALLVGGGGNDIVQPSHKPGSTWLYKMLVPGATTAAKALNAAEVDKFIDQILFNHYKTVLGELRAATNVPILVHGYDHPVPDGRDAKVFGIGPGPWMKPVFAARGMNKLDLNREVMRLLIERLNTMIVRVVTGYKNVHHLPFTGTLPNKPATAYSRWWDNELHPSAEGYAKLASVLAAKLKSLGV